MGKCIITQGGGGGISPDDLTASPNDVLKGKIAGVNGYDEPVEGTLELTGTATNDKVLSGYTYYNTDALTKQTGTMANNGEISASLNCGGSKTIPAGYTTGGTVTANSLASQTGIDSGKTAISAGQVLTGYQGWVNGSKITGSMTNRGAWTSSLGINGKVTIPAGYHNGSGYVNQSISTMGAQTITPSTSSQTVSCSGKYMTGNVTVNAIPSSYVNISSGASVFKNGVWGSFMDVAIDGVQWADGTTSTVDSNWEYIVGPISKRGSSSWQGTINDGCLYAKGYGVFLSFVTNKSVNLTPFKTLRVYVWTTTSYACLYTSIIPTDKAGLYMNDRDLNTSYTFSNPQILNIDISRFTGHHFFNIHTSGLKGGEAGFKEIILLS